MAGCPQCGVRDRMRLVRTRESVVVKGESYIGSGTAVKCEACGSKFFHPATCTSARGSAYQKYREAQGLLSAGDIRRFRERFGLTQKEFGDILGFGDVTLSRYERERKHSDRSSRQTYAKRHAQPPCFAVRPVGFQKVLFGRPDQTAHAEYTWQVAPCKKAKETGRAEIQVHKGSCIST